MNKVEFIKKEDMKYEPDWRADLYDHDVWYLIINNQVVLEVVLFIENGYVIINNIESRTPGKGYGRLAMKYIKEIALNHNCSKIYGESIYHAWIFWDEMGANFKTILPYKVENNDLYPFHIEVER